MMGLHSVLSLICQGCWELLASHGRRSECTAGRTNIQTAGETAEDKAICSNKGQGSSRPIKSVVFSQFTSMLNLIGDALR